MSWRVSPNHLDSQGSVNGNRRNPIVLVIIEDSRGRRLAELCANGHIEFARTPGNLGTEGHIECNEIAKLGDEAFLLAPRTIVVVSCSTIEHLSSIRPQRSSYFKGFTMFENDLFVWTNNVDLFHLAPCPGGHRQLKLVGQTDIDSHKTGVIVQVRVLRKDVLKNLFEFAYGDPIINAMHRVKCDATTGEFISRETVFEGARIDALHPVGVDTENSEYTIHWDRGESNLWLVKLARGEEVVRIVVSQYCYEFKTAFISNSHIIIKFRTSPKLYVLTMLNVKTLLSISIRFGEGEEITNIVPLLANM